MLCFWNLYVKETEVWWRRWASGKVQLPTSWGESFFPEVKEDLLMARGQGLGDAKASRTRDVIIIYILRAPGDKESILYSAFTECLRLPVYMQLLIDGV